MKKLHLILMAKLLLSVSMLPAVAASTEVIIYGDADYPPYSFEEGKTQQGIYTKILQSAFAKMPDYQIRIELVPWKRGLRHLERGTGFALYPPYQNKDRTYIEPYSEKILAESVYVFCQASVLQPFREKWPDDYMGLRIGINRGFSLGGEVFWQAVQDGKIEVEEASGSTKNLLKLATARTDCYMNDRLSILWEIKKLKASGEYSADHFDNIQEGALVAGEWGYLGFTNQDKGKFPFKDDFIEKFNAVILKMRNTGEIDDIVDAYVGGE